MACIQELAAAAALILVTQLIYSGWLITLRPEYSISQFDFCSYRKIQAVQRKKGWHSLDYHNIQSPMGWILC